MGALLGIAFNILQSLHKCRRTVYALFGGIVGLVCACISASVSLSAQNLAFSHLGIEHGLSQGTAFCFLHDRKGFLWIGTEDGLNRYDGYTFRIYRSNPKDSASIANNNVYSLHEDNQGYIWVGTARGVCRYNPRTDNFFTLRRSAKLSSLVPLASHQGAPSKPVFAFAADNFGSVWVASIGAGIYCLNTASLHSFQYATTPDSTGLLDNNVYSLANDRRTGRLWVGTEAGLCLVLPNLTLFTSAQQSQQQLAQQSQQRGAWQITNFLRDPAVPLPVRKGIIRTLCYDRLGRLWVGVFGAGMFRYDEARREWCSYEVSKHREASVLPGKEILSAYIDTADVLWVGTKQGLFRYAANTDTFTGDKHNPQHTQTLRSNSISALYGDRSGVVWIGTSGLGIHAYNPNAKQFRVYKNEPFHAENRLSENRLSDNVVRGFVQDSAGVLWIATANGLNSYNLQTQQWRTFRADSTRSNALPDNDIRALALTPDGTLWIGTHTGGLCSYDTRRNRFRRYDFNPQDSSGMDAKTVLSLYCDRRGMLWVGTLGKGLLRCNTSFHAASRAGSRLSVLPHFSQMKAFDAKAKEWFALGSVRAIAEDRKGDLYFGTMGSGLFHYVSHLPPEQAFTHYLADNNDTNSLNMNVIYALYADSLDNVWVGTDGGGLNRFQPATKKFRAWREEQGLPNNVVAGIVPDAQGNLWLGTNKGIAKFSPALGTVRNYDLSDGLPSNQCNRGAAYRLRSGELLFGTMQGFTRFLPENISDNTYLPPVVLTAFKKFNTIVALDTSITYRQTLELRHDDAVVSFEFAALNFISPEKNRYAYKLEGLHDRWIDLGAERTVSLTSSPPGAYTLRLRASNNDGLWNEAGAVLELRVLPPWWKTWWFYAVSAIVVVLGTGAAVYSRVQFVERQNRKLKELVRQRTGELQASLEEIAATNAEMQRQNQILEDQACEIEIANTTLQEKNLTLEHLNNEKNEFLGIAAHDLKNPLAHIIMSTSTVTRYYERMSDNDILQYLGNIGTVAKRMSEIITNLLDVNAIERDGMRFVTVPFDIVPYLRNVVQSYSAPAAEKGICFHLDTPAQALAFADEQATVQVLDNLISNAVKYSPHGKNVFVRLKASNDTVRIEVQDEGQGISPEDMKKLFGKFARLSARPTGGEHSTGLGLSIVKKMVEAMQGRVWCESEYGGGLQGDSLPSDSPPGSGLSTGATFIVELPLVE